MFCGCQVGPNYKAPEASVSDSFDIGPELLPTTLPTTPPMGADATTQPTVPSSESLAAATRAATQPSAPIDLTHWWTALDDAELNSLVSRAVESNLDVAIAAARVQEIRETYAAVSGDAFPVFAPAEHSPRGRARTTPRAESMRTLNAGTNTAGLKEITQVVGFDTGWEIDLFGRLARQEEAAQADVESSMEARNQVLVTVIADVAHNYIDLRSYQLRLRITDDNIAALRRTLDLTRISLRQGIGTELDVVLSERQLAAALCACRAAAGVDPAIREADRGAAGLEAGRFIRRARHAGGDSGDVGDGRSGHSTRSVSPAPDIRQAERQLAAATARIGVATAAPSRMSASLPASAYRARVWAAHPLRTAGFVPPAHFSAPPSSISDSSMRW